jgi:hypothetical protein
MASCTKHGKTETFLSCTACELPYCHECLIPGPVGSKCRSCSQLKPNSSDARKNFARTPLALTGSSRSVRLLFGLVALAALIAVVAAGQRNRTGETVGSPGAGLAGVWIGSTDPNVSAATIVFWEERTDYGDAQMERLTCEPEPEVTGMKGSLIRPPAFDPQRACDWLMNDATHRNLQVTCPKTKAIEIVWRLEMQGFANGKSFSNVFEGSDTCQQQLATEAAAVFGIAVNEPATPRA